jgi:hypothetical protein
MFNKGEAKLKLNRGPQVDLTEDSGLFFLRITFQRFSAYESTCNTSKAAVKGDMNLWHQRLGHLNKEDVKRTIGREDNPRSMRNMCTWKAIE